MDNEIEIEIVSTDDVLRDYSIANNPFCSKYIKFNPPVKFTVDFKKNETPEETIERLNKIYIEDGIDALAETLREEGFYITNIQYSFGDEQPFTEEVTICGMEIGKMGAMDDN